jgi:hypothetical protein
MGEVCSVVFGVAELSLWFWVDLALSKKASTRLRNLAYNTESF